MRGDETMTQVSGLTIEEPKELTPEDVSLVDRMETEYQRVLGERFGYKSARSGSWFREAMTAAFLVARAELQRNEYSADSQPSD